MTTRRRSKQSRPAWHCGLRAILEAAVTPLLEKNVVKTLALDAPVVFSMSRVIVLAFAVGMLRQIWRAGVAGWPDATLSIAIVLALPLLGALERVKPGETIELAKTLFRRIGIGGVRHGASVFGEEPSKFDDHRNDS